MSRLALLFTVIIFAAVPHTSSAKTICTIVIDAASSDILHEDGKCDIRATPASTFKVALALIGFDAGYLKSAQSPVLPFKEGYADWGVKAWRKDTTPERWMRYSVVWYSQQITNALGAQRISAYLQNIGFGNADFSGDKGFNNGLERAWIASSLEISPREQVHYLSRMLNHELPVSAKAVELTKSIVQIDQAQSGWTVHGKTGLAFPRNADRSFNRSRGFGWYVGWAEKDGRRVVFARLLQDEKLQKQTVSTRAKASLLNDLSALID
ncbi:class D beta-lactamase [Ahrensia kielensis]|uniref:Beta-lactamase n=1 Tax=Ahrensia kielensis TaxID=76980 RepID=A0ABU9T7J1_9HYPH